MSGEFIVVNQHLLDELNQSKLWNSNIKNELLDCNGSIQALSLPVYIKEIYKTVWEIKQRIIIEMAADRGAFIDQSQSLNIHMSKPNFGKLTSLHFHAWKKGLKTGMYYLRSRAAASAIKFTVDQQALKKKKCKLYDIHHKIRNKIERVETLNTAYGSDGNSCSMCTG